MTTSLREGHVVTLPSVGLIADVAAVKTVGKENFRVCKHLVDDMVTVSKDEVCNAINWLTMTLVWYFNLPGLRQWPN